MSKIPGKPDAILDLYADIQAVVKSASLREYKPTKLNTLNSVVRNKIDKLRESEQSDLFSENIEKLWSSFPAEQQANSSAYFADILDSILSVSSSTTSADSLRRASKGVTPARVYRQSSSRADFSSPALMKNPSTRLFGGTVAGYGKEEDPEVLAKFEAIQAKLDKVTKAKDALELELRTAKDYVDISNANINASKIKYSGLENTLAQAENKIEELEDEVTRLKAATETIPALQKAVTETDSYSKYIADRMREVVLRVEEEEAKNDTLRKGLENAYASEANLAKQLKEALARNEMIEQQLKNTAPLSDAGSTRSSSPPPNPHVLKPVVATKRRNVQETTPDAVEVQETKEGVLEFPARRLSTSSPSQPPVGFASVKDMWKRKESIGKNVPVLPPASVAATKESKGSFTVAGADREYSAKDFWKQRDSVGANKKPIYPVNIYTKVDSFKKSSDTERPGSRRLSIDGMSFAIPAYDSAKKLGVEDDVRDTEDIPEGIMVLPEILSRKSSTEKLVDKSAEKGTVTPKGYGTPKGYATPRPSSPVPSSYNTANGSPPRDVTSVTPSLASLDGTSTPPSSLVSAPYSTLHTKVTPILSTVPMEVNITPSHHMNNFEAFDPDRVLDDEEPIVLFETGESETRMGLWNVKKKCFECNFSCPTVAAIPMKGGGKPQDIVRGANIGSDPMYQLFRETGVFVGKDAWYCCFDHPDAGLRGVLELKNLISGGRIRRPDAFVMMIQQCISKTLPLDADLQELQIIFSYNVACDRLDLAKVARRTFEVLGCNKICFIDEASLVTIGAGLNDGFASALVVDIGTTSTRVQPVYENLTMRAAAVLGKVGGDHCTSYLELLLHAQTSERFSQQRAQRRTHIARELKKKYAFVCESFSTSIADFGEFSFEEVNVMQAMGGAIPVKPKKASRSTDLTSSIRAKEAVNLPDGSVIVFTMDIERFYCAEVLFKPDLWEECKDQPGLPALILKSASLIDSLVRQDVCERIVLAGKTALLPGLQARLHAELKEGMAALGVPNFQIIIAEEHLSNGDIDSPLGRSHPSASWKGADYRVKRATDPFVPYNIEPQHFVTIGDYEEQGNALEPNLF